MLSLSLAARERAAEAVTRVLRDADRGPAGTQALGTTALRILSAIARTRPSELRRTSHWLRRSVRLDEPTARAIIRAYVAALDEHARVVCLMTRGPDDRAAAEHEARVLRMHAIAVERSLPRYERALAREWPGLAAEVAREVEQRSADADAAAKVERKAKRTGGATA